MASLSLPTAVERGSPSPALDDATPDAVWIAGFGNPVAADYAEYLRTAGGVEVRVVDGGMRVAEHTGSSHLVLFHKAKPTVNDRKALDDLLALAHHRDVKLVCLVSTFRVHFGDRAAGESEAFVMGRTRALGLRTVVLRPSQVISGRSCVGATLRRFGAAYPLVPRRLRTSFIAGNDLFAAIEKERRACAASQSVRARRITLLGPNRPWKDVLKEQRSRSFIALPVTAFSAIVSLLCLGHVAALIAGLLFKRQPAWRSANFDTLVPRSFEGLLALYNPYTYRHVRVVGYNNGVNHFGHRYPGKTVVSTVALNRVVRIGADIIKADCGTTIRKARDFVGPAGQDLYVIPNYSYVCLGTAFFVPIHGSASDYSCVAETITRAVLYDPIEDRIVRAERNGPEFQRFAYNQTADVLLLRLQMRVKPKASYFLHQEEVEAPSSEQMLAALRDVKAANVEVRKPKASASAAQIYRYYVQADDSKGPVMEVPRDSLGRLWDKLEENRITSFLMHALTRHLAFHVELFFTETQFKTFWAQHRSLPLKKIQLRYIRRDGLANSPFRDQDCVSSDMFMFRRQRRAFEDFIRRTLPDVRANPGKHSM